MSRKTALKVDFLSVEYGGIKAVRDVSLEVGEGERVTLIGANGAGKTSTLKALIGLVASTAGKVELFGENITELPAHRIAARGVALVPEGRAVFAGMTVRENMLLGGFLRRRPAQLKRNMERCIDLFPRLGERLKQDAGTLSGGEQQMLAIARGLMAEPKLLLLDEPSLGLAPKLVAQIFEAIMRIARSGITILLVEQNTRLALEMAHRAYVLVTGEIVLSGECLTLREDPRIADAYLGNDVCL